MILGNKCDLTMVREVDKMTAQHTADDLDCKFMETSARTGINIENVCVFDIA